MPMGIQIMHQSQPFRSAFLALSVALWAFTTACSETKIDKTFGRPHITAVQGKVKEIPDAKVIDFRKVVYEGPIDVNSTLDRIREGKKLDHPNDGSFFQNRERKLPVMKNREYYREFVHWDPKLNAKFKIKVKFPGPQRVVIGKKGEVYYTGDHYNSWKKAN
jgi:filamentous hemagglutinin